MKVIDYGTKDVLLSYGDTAGEIIEVVRMNHNEEMGFDRSQGSDEERFFLCVPERGEDCTFTVKDICTADSVTYDGGLDNTLFEVSAGDAALIHDGAIGHVFDSNYVSVATGSFSSSDGGFNVSGDWSSSTLIGFQYSVGGEDIGFCSNARRAGFDIYVDTDCEVMHLSQLAVTKDTWKLYKKLKDAERSHTIEHGAIKTKES